MLVLPAGCENHRYTILHGKEAWREEVKRAAFVCFGFHVKAFDWGNLIFLREEKR